jgi:hypothetical protein
MSVRGENGSAGGVKSGNISRRRLLAATGLVAAGGLSGCLGRVASAVTNTGSSPAAVFAGTDWNDDDTEVTFEMAPGSPHVARLTPTLAGRVELEGWVTSSAVVTQNHNSSRSHKHNLREDDGDSDGDGVGDGTAGPRANYNNTRSNRSGIRPPDILDDELEADDETVRRVSQLDARLQEATTAAATAISKRSARTGRNPEIKTEITEALGDMGAVLAEMRAVLERCSDESCVAALTNVGHREADVRRATEHVENGEWGAFGMTGGDDDDLLVGDYLLPSAAFDPSGSFSAAEQAVLFRYLDETSVVAERFSVCLPDAEVPGGNGSIREAVTPKRLIAYLTAGDGGDLLSRADSKSRAVGGGGDCDDDDTGVYPGALCGTTPHFVAEVTGPVATGGSLDVVRADDGTVVVINSPPEADGGPAAVRVSAEGGSDGPESSTEAIYQAWTGSSNSSGEPSAEVVETLVAQVLVQPPQCPVPFPALFYVGRAESDGQLLYSGGWVIDDAALYAHSATVLSTAGPTRVVGIECCFDYDSDGDGFGDVLARAGLSERERRGARPAAGPAEELVTAGVLSESVGGAVLARIRMRPGREQDGESRGDVTGDEYGFVTNVPVDAPVLHLLTAASASDEVKLKAGAELSKAVN